jgi:hypothetical protein
LPANQRPCGTRESGKQISVETVIGSKERQPHPSSAAEWIYSPFDRGCAVGSQVDRPRRAKPRRFRGLAAPVVFNRAYPPCSFRVCRMLPMVKEGQKRTSARFAVRDS